MSPILKTVPSSLLKGVLLVPSAHGYLHTSPSMNVFIYNIEYCVSSLNFYINGITSVHTHILLKFMLFWK